MIYYNVVFCHEYEDEEAVMTYSDHNFDSGRESVWEEYFVPYGIM
jgi:hypothetical protein